MRIGEMKLLDIILSSNGFFDRPCAESHKLHTAPSTPRLTLKDPQKFLLGVELLLHHVRIKLQLNLSASVIAEAWVILRQKLRRVLLLRRDDTRLEFLHSQLQDAPRELRLSPQLDRQFTQSRKPVPPRTKVRRSMCLSLTTDPLTDLSCKSRCLRSSTGRLPALYRPSDSIPYLLELLHCSAIPGSWRPAIGQPTYLPFTRQQSCITSP